MTIFKGWTLDHEQAGDKIRFVFTPRRKGAKPTTVLLDVTEDDLAAYADKPDATAKRLRSVAERRAEGYLAGLTAAGLGVGERAMEMVPE